MLESLLPNDVGFPGADSAQLTQALSLLSLVVDMREYYAGGGRPETLCGRLTTLVSELHIFARPHLL